MKIDFSKVKVTPSLGEEPQEIDMKNEVANLIYRNAKDVAAASLGLKIYRSDGAADYTEDEMSIMRDAVKQITYYWQRKPLEDLLNND